LINDRLADCRVARSFLVQHNKTGKNIPKWPQNTLHTWTYVKYVYPNGQIFWVENLPSGNPGALADISTFDNFFFHRRLSGGVMGK
jgi:hypothetical protein